MQLFHIYVGTQYQGPARGHSEVHAVRVFASQAGKSPRIYHAKPATTVLETKQQAK